MKAQMTLHLSLKRMLSTTATRACHVQGRHHSAAASVMNVVWLGQCAAMGCHCWAACWPCRPPSASCTMTCWCLFCCSGWTSRCCTSTLAAPTPLTGGSICQMCRAPSTSSCPGGMLAVMVRTATCRTLAFTCLVSAVWEHQISKATLDMLHCHKI